MKHGSVKIDPTDNHYSAPTIISHLIASLTSVRPLIDYAKLTETEFLLTESCRKLIKHNFSRNTPISAEIYIFCCNRKRTGTKRGTETKNVTETERKTCLDYVFISLFSFCLDYISVLFLFGLSFCFTAARCK